jgi:predicted DNA-binding transcriptional regulator AlpA
MESENNLKDTRWLAEKLGLSVSTIERLRAIKSTELPPFITINKSIRYDKRYVDWWLLKQIDPNLSNFE